MQISDTALKELCKIINGDYLSLELRSKYRTGPELVDFFNKLGFSDTYSRRNTPSRWKYTDEKLAAINGTPELEACIRQTFAAIDYVGKYQELDRLIAHFNQYLNFDEWKIIREDDQIRLQQTDKVIIPSTDCTMPHEANTPVQQNHIDVKSLSLGAEIESIIEERLEETKKCIEAKAPLAAIILIGSILEGILYAMASRYSKEYNQAGASPKDKDNDKKVRSFSNWTLTNFIDVAHEIGMIENDSHKFNQVIREYRNYVHLREQLKSRFKPTIKTAQICLQALRLAIANIGDYLHNNTK